MHKVDGHIEVLAVDLLLAGPVKVELLKLIFLVADHNETSGPVVDHDGVAVINDVQGRTVVINADRGNGGSLRIADVNGRLAMPILAHCEFRRQVTPMIWTMRVAVIPSVLRMVL